MIHGEFAVKYGCKDLEMRTKLQKFQIKYGCKDLEMRNNSYYRNLSRFELKCELKFKKVSMS
jgi:hypothetical protein